jgi:hypothetical protein
MEPDKYPVKTLPESTPEEPGVRLFRAILTIILNMSPGGAAQIFRTMLDWCRPAGALLMQ